MQVREVNILTSGVHYFEKNVNFNAFKLVLPIFTRQNIAMHA